MRLARSFVARTLRAWKLGTLVDDAQPVVSELASNAVCTPAAGYASPCAPTERSGCGSSFGMRPPACHSRSPFRTTRRAVEVYRWSLPCVRAGASIVRGWQDGVGCDSPWGMPAPSSPVASTRQQRSPRRGSNATAVTPTPTPLIYSSSTASKFRARGPVRHSHGLGVPDAKDRLLIQEL